MREGTIFLFTKNSPFGWNIERRTELAMRNVEIGEHTHTHKRTIYTFYIKIILKKDVSTMYA